VIGDYSYRAIYLQKTIKSQESTIKNQLPPGSMGDADSYCRSAHWRFCRKGAPPLSGNIRPGCSWVKIFLGVSGKIWHFCCLKI